MEKRESKSAGLEVRAETRIAPIIVTLTDDHGHSGFSSCGNCHYTFGKEESRSNCPKCRYIMGTAELGPSFGGSDF